MIQGFLRCDAHVQPHYSVFTALQRSSSHFLHPPITPVTMLDMSRDKAFVDCIDIFQFLATKFHLWKQAFYSGPGLPRCFISIVKRITSNCDLLPLVFHYAEWRPDANLDRTLKFPARDAVCAQNTNALTIAHI